MQIKTNTVGIFGSVQMLRQTTKLDLTEYKENPFIEGIHSSFSQTAILDSCSPGPGTCAEHPCWADRTRKLEFVLLIVWIASIGEH